MTTNATRNQQTASHRAEAPLGQNAGTRRMSASPAESSDDAAAKPAGYGLPCAKCRLYYPANLDFCPTCHHQERVSPKVPKVPLKPAEAIANPAPDRAALEQEREEFLRQFNSQVSAAQAANSGTACAFGDHRPGDDGNAVICGACFERLQERLDVLEAALHLDSKEAAQIIYEAVWADPSDPSKTYENAAKALLAELRKRAGLNSLLVPFRPLPD